MTCSTSVSYTHLDVYKRQDFNERGNGFVNDKQGDIADMGISLRSVMTCSTLVCQNSMKMCIRDRPTVGQRLYTWAELVGLLRPGKERSLAEMKASLSSGRKARNQSS